MRGAMAMLGLCVWLGAFAAAGADGTLDLNVSTPAIVKLRAALAARAEAVGKLKDAAFAGEGREGMLEIRTLDKVELSKKKEIQDLVTAENADRRALYVEILKACGLPESELGRVMQGAAAQYRAAAAAGHYVQHPESGAWILARELPK
ncbi:MAG: DUF1318 domain-containing protein [Planctomycetes bacterium]|nr:DUF1318 domain-containing protein [Planctomycetota bacterium]